MTAAPTAPAGPPPAAPGATTDVRARAPRLVSLDALRLAAAVAVVVYHFTGRTASSWGPEQTELLRGAGAWTSYGSLGPELFFVISGFVILMTAWDRTTVSVVASRIGRLYPSYWVAVLLTGALLLWLWPGGKDVTPGQVAVNMTMMQAAAGVPHVDGVYWTLWTELRFYLLIGVLVLVGVTRRRVLVFAAVWPPVAYLVQRVGPPELAELLISHYASLFAAGMALFLIYREGHAVVPWLVVAGNAGLAAYLIAPSRTAVLSRVTDHVPSTTGLAVGVVLCVVAVAVVALTPLSRLDRPWLVTAGALTYPLYLVHQYWGLYVIDVLVDRDAPAWLALAAAMGVALTLAWCVQRLVEAPYAPRLRRASERLLTGLRDRLLFRVNHGPRALETAEQMHLLEPRPASAARVAAER